MTSPFAFSVRCIIPLCLMLFCLNDVNGQGTNNCVAFDPFAYPSLAQFVNNLNLYYAPNGLAALEVQASSFAIFLAGVKDPTCQSALSTFYSAKIFRPCDAITQQPRSPCSSLCSAVVSACTSNSDLTVASNFFGDNFANPNMCSTSYSNNTATCYPNTLPSPAPIPRPGRCEVLDQGSICASVLSKTTPYYIPGGYCQNGGSSLPNCILYDSLISNTTALYQALNATNPGCASSVYNMLCNLVYMPCDTTAVTTAIPAITTPLPLPQLPAVGYCNAVVNQCNYNVDFLTVKSPGAGGGIINVTIPNLSSNFWTIQLLVPSQYAPNPTCTNTVPKLNNQPLFPADFTVFYNNNGIKIQTAANPYVSSNVVPPQAQCVPFDSNQIIAGFPTLLPNGGTRAYYDVPRSYCMNVVPEGSLVYLPPGQTLASLNLNSKLRSTQWVFAVAPRDNGCSVAMAKYVCSQIFMPCTNNLISMTVYPSSGVPASLNIGLQISFPNPPCQSICNDYNNLCQFLFQGTGAVLAPGDCATVSKSVGPLFPSNATGPAKVTLSSAFSTGTVVNSQPDFGNKFIANLYVPPFSTSPAPGGTPYAPISAQFTATCSNSNTQLTADKVPYYCPYPTVDPFQPDAFGRIGGFSVPTLAPPNTTGVAGSCAVRCPVPIYTLSQYDSSRNFYTGISAVSFAILLFMTVSFLLFPEKREKTNVTYFILSTWIVSLALILSPFNDIQKTACLNNSVEATQQNGASGIQVFQAWLVHYASSSAVIWWAIQSIDVLLQVSVKRKITEEIRKIQRIVYHVVAWTVPLLFSLAALGTNSLGQTKGMPFNFMVKNYWSAFQLIVATCIVVGCTCMTAIIIVIIKSSRASRNSTFITQLRVLLRPILFIFSFLFVFSIVISYTAYGDIVNDDVTNSIVKWILCILNDSPSIYYNFNVLTRDCGATSEIVPNYNLFMAFNFAVAGQGIMVFLTYGTEKRLFELWYLLIRSCKVPKSAASQGSQAASVNSKSNKTIKSRNTQNKSHLNRSAVNQNAAANENLKRIEHDTMEMQQV